MSSLATETHHINEADQFFKVRVNFEVLDLLRFQLFSGTLHPDQGSCHLEQLHALQVSQTPEQHLNTHMHTRRHKESGL